MIEGCKMEPNIGEKVRKLRKKNNFTIQELCNKTGLSYSFLSNLENNKHSITISNLNKIANVFKIELNDFFIRDDLDNEPYLVRKNEEKYLTDDNIKIQSLSSRKYKLFEVFLWEISKNSSYNSEYHKHQSGEELIYVIKGKLRVSIDGKEYILESGDSLHFRSELKHKYETVSAFSQLVIIKSRDQNNL